jgi:hypothetical protein
MFGNNNGGFGGFGNDGALWLIVLLALIWGGNNGNNGFGFGNGGFDDGYAWLSNGQKEIMNNTNNGFDTLHLSNQIEGARDSIHGISNQICSSTSDVVSAINSGFYGAEISANNREMNRTNQMFDLQSQLAQCCCENRLATCQTQNIIQNEGNQTRFADANNTRDIIESANRNSQAILDKLCQLELDAKNDKIGDLQREVLMKDLAASQVQQTANIVDMTYSRLRDCPIDSTPIYGRIPIFTCNGNNGCGCNGYNQFV